MKRLQTPTALAAVLFGFTAVSAAPRFAAPGTLSIPLVDDEDEESSEEADEEEGPRWTAVVLSLIHI